MPEEVRLWEVLERKHLREMEKPRLDLERRLEDWLEADISMLSKDLLVIGRQVKTDSGGIIDLLCIDSQGDLTIVELKRDKTPREITAQTLDYASWVKDLSNERITEITNARFGEEDALGNAFRKRFRTELPEVINENHNMLIVASEIDASSERIVHYLSETYGVSINVVTFQYFRNADEREFLARVFLIEPEHVEYKTRTRGGSKRPPSTVEEICARADEMSIGEEFRTILHAARSHGLYPRPYRNSVMYTPPSNRSRMLFTVWLKSGIRGPESMAIAPEAFAEFYPVDEETAVSVLGPSGWRDAYEDVDSFVAGLDGLFESMEVDQAK